jgi:hypothetical protein
MYVHCTTNKYLNTTKNKWKTLLNKMKRRSWGKYWTFINKEEIELLSAILLLHGIVEKPKIGYYFSHNRLLAMPIFHKMMTEKRLLLLHLLKNSWILLTMRVTMNRLLQKFTKWNLCLATWFISFQTTTFLKISCQYIKAYY